jgi:phosphatidylglycerol:prolipoprotein diacylglycerol transferase
LHVLADGYFWDYVHLCTNPSLVAWPVPRSECLNELSGMWDAQAAVCRPKQADCWAWAQIWGGGLTFYGGLIAATAAAFWLFRRDRFPFWKGVDMGGMMVPIGLGFGRMGCFLAGCCFGKPSDAPWAVAFPPFSPASEAQELAGLLPHKDLASLAVHPTQLYEAAAAFLIAAVGILYVHGRKRYDGAVFAVFIGGYGMMRFVLELWRADARGGFAGLSTSQWIGLLMVGLALGIHRLRSSGPKPVPA